MHLKFVINSFLISLERLNNFCGKSYEILKTTYLSHLEHNTVLEVTKTFRGKMFRICF